MIIDTSIIIQYIRTKNKSATILYNIPNQEKLFISTVSLYELYIGANSIDKKLDIQLVTRNLVVLPFTYPASLKAAEIYLQLKAKNQLIEFRDIFIAATCITQNFPITTLNKKHFERIEGLKVA